MWEFREHRVCEDFDAAGPEQYRAWRETDAGLPLVTLYRTEYARWEDPDAAEPEKLGVLMVAWELVEKPCECGSDPDDVDDECMCDDLADALGGVLSDWDVHATSVWEASAQPWHRIVGHVWVSAHENYEFESSTRYDYSLHVSGPISEEIRARVFGAVGVE